MNKPATWRIVLMFLALIFGMTYSIPNFFGELPAVQVSSTKATVKVTGELIKKIEVNQKHDQKLQNDKTNAQEEIIKESIAIKPQKTKELKKPINVLEKVEDTDSKNEDLQEFKASMGDPSEVPDPQTSKTDEKPKGKKIQRFNQNRQLKIS